MVKPVLKDSLSCSDLASRTTAEVHNCIQLWIRSYISQLYFEDLWWQNEPIPFTLSFDLLNFKMYMFIWNTESSKFVIYWILLSIFTYIFCSWIKSDKLSFPCLIINSRMADVWQCPILLNVDGFQAICQKLEAGHSIFLAAWTKWYQPPHCKWWGKKKGRSCCFSCLRILLWQQVKRPVLANLIIIVKHSNYEMENGLEGGRKQDKKGQVFKQCRTDQLHLKATWHEKLK